MVETEANSSRTDSQWKKPLGGHSSSTVAEAGLKWLGSGPEAAGLACGSTPARPACQGKRCRNGEENRLVTVIQTGDKACHPPRQETRYDDDSDGKAESSLTRSDHKGPL